MAATLTVQYSPLPDHSAEVIDAYKKSLLQRNAAWIVCDSHGTERHYSVVHSLEPVIGTLAKERVEKAVADALSFLEDYGHSIYPSSDHIHELFLGEVEHSFSPAPVPVNVVALMEQITEVRFGFEKAGLKPILDVTTTLKIYASGFPLEKLGYSDELLKACDLVILAGEDRVPIPCRKAELLGRSERWDAFIQSMLRKEASSVIPLEAHPPSAIMDLLKAIRAHDLDTWPDKAEALTDLALLAYDLGEERLLEGAVHELTKQAQTVCDADLLPRLRNIDVDSLGAECKAAITSLTVAALWKKKPAELSRGEMAWLLQQDECPESEVHVFKSLIEWERPRLAGGQLPGTLLSDSSGGSSLLDLIRFEQMSADEYIAAVLDKAFISPAQHMAHLQRLQALYEEPELSSGEVYRKPSVSIEPYSGGGYKISVQLPVTAEALKLTGANRWRVLKTVDFQLYGSLWSIYFDEMLQDGKNFHGVFLYHKRSPTGKERTFCYAFQTGHAASPSFKTHTWEIGKGYGSYLGKATPLAEMPFYKDNRITVTVHLRPA